MSGAPALVCQGLTVRYGSVTALEDIDIVVEHGSATALVGPNGAGKSTLFGAVLGLTPVSAGAVWVDPALAGAIGHVAQRQAIDWSFPFTVADVVMLGRTPRRRLFSRPTETDRNAVSRALATLRIEALASRPIAALSGGQQQRVFVARALAGEPRLLLLDEPFAGVDAPTTAAILHLLAAFCRAGKTVLVATHDLGLVPDHFDRVVCVNRRVIATGRPDILADRGVVQATFGKRAFLFGHAVVG